MDKINLLKDRLQHLENQIAYLQENPENQMKKTAVGFITFDSMFPARIPAIHTLRDPAKLM